MVEGFSQQAFIQNQNASNSDASPNASNSEASPNFEHGFLYFPHLNRKWKNTAADAQSAGEWNAETSLVSKDGNTQIRLEDFIHVPSPLGLKLQKTQYLAKLLEMKMQINAIARRTRATLSLVERAEMLKSEPFPISLFRIGAFEIVTKHESHLVAKCYYGQQKLVWEISEYCLKNRIEVPWQNILGMRATIDENSPGILEIELYKEPTFYHQACDPDPRKHCTWELSTDFTEGQALTYRRHYLEFPPGVLNKRYEKLIQCDERLLQLSQGPFPSLSSPYFDSVVVSTQGLNDYANILVTDSVPSVELSTPMSDYGNSSVNANMWGTHAEVSSTSTFARPSSMKVDHGHSNTYTSTQFTDHLSNPMYSRDDIVPTGRSEEHNGL